MGGVVYLGTSEFAAAVLDALAAGPHRPALVITRPDRPAGRGRRLTPPPVAEAARRLDIALSQPDSVNSEEARAQIAALKPDAVCVCAFGALIREPLLSDHELLNIHPSLLPRWRGAAPVERAIMAGDERTGVCVMRVVAELDAGPVYACEPEPILPDDDFGSLSARLQPLAAALLTRVLAEGPAPKAQPATGETYAEKITAEDRELDGARMTAHELDRVVRALHPHIGARVRLDGGDWLGVERATVVMEAGAEPGRLFGGDTGLMLACTVGALRLDVVRPAGGRPMAGDAFLRGHPAVARG